MRSHEVGTMTFSGNMQVLVFEANLTSSLQDLRTAVQEKLGIMTEQQRLIVVGEAFAESTSSSALFHS